MKSLHWLIRDTTKSPPCRLYYLYSRFSKILKWSGIWRRGKIINSIRFHSASQNIFSVKVVVRLRIWSKYQNVFNYIFPKRKFQFLIYFLFFTYSGKRKLHLWIYQWLRPTPSNFKVLKIHKHFLKLPYYWPDLVFRAIVNLKKIWSKELRFLNTVLSLVAEIST